MSALILAITAALPANLNADLQVPAGHEPYLVAPATGVQIHERAERTAAR